MVAAQIIQGLKVLPELIKEVLALDGKIEELARGLKSARSMLVMGRGYNYATCLEGALVSGRRQLGSAPQCYELDT